MHTLLRVWKIYDIDMSSQSILYFHLWQDSNAMNIVVKKVFFLCSKPNFNHVGNQGV